MGLRNHFNADFYIPLVAGVESAREGDGGDYDPGWDDDGPAGICGRDWSEDPTVGTPTITFPNSGDNSDINPEEDGDIATSSAFTSTNGQTHLRSRWVIEYRGEVGEPDESPYVHYDSGPTATHLTSLPLELAQLARDRRYAIKVRYQGSNNVCGPWSPYQEFTTHDCTPILPDLILWVDASDADTLTTSFLDGKDRVTHWDDKSPEENHLIGATAAAGQYSDVLVDRFPAGAMNMTNGLGFMLTNPLEPVDGKMTAFMVCWWPDTGVGNYRGIGFYNGIDSFDDAHLGAYASVANTGTALLSGPAFGVAGAASSLPVDAPYVLEFLIDDDATNRALQNGVQVGSNTDNISVTFDRMGVQNGSFGWTGAIGGQIAEVMVFGAALDSTQREYIRNLLADKWGITL